MVLDGDIGCCRANRKSPCLRIYPLKSGPSDKPQWRPSILMQLQRAAGCDLPCEPKDVACPEDSQCHMKTWNRLEKGSKTQPQYSELQADSQGNPTYKGD